MVIYTIEIGTLNTLIFISRAFYVLARWHTWDYWEFSWYRLIFFDYNFAFSGCQEFYVCVCVCATPSPHSPSHCSKAILTRRTIPSTWSASCGKFTISLVSPFTHTLPILHVFCDLHGNKSIFTMLFIMAIFYVKLIRLLDRWIELFWFFLCCLLKPILKLHMEYISANKSHKCNIGTICQCSVLARWNWAFQFVNCIIARYHHTLDHQPFQTLNGCNNKRYELINVQHFFPSILLSFGDVIKLLFLLKLWCTVWLPDAQEFISNRVFPSSAQLK